MRRSIYLFCALLFIAKPLSAQQVKQSLHNVTTSNHAFRPGEKLTYTISWSNVFSAGTAVMEVKSDTQSNEKSAFRLTSIARTVGMVDALFPVMDTVQSVLDARELYSLSYSLNQSHGKRIRRKEAAFDHARGAVAVVSDGKTETFDIPPRAQDALSSLYYLRTREDFSTDGPIVIDVYDGGKTWAVEIQTMGREKIKTPLGEFNTIKIKTYPKYEGVFLHKGEIFMWLTDDSRKVPVLMKSKISIGSIVATLIEMKQGEELE